MAEAEGLSISEFYARAAKAHIERLRRRTAVEDLDRRAGSVEVQGDVDEALREMRADDPGRP